VTYGDPTLHTKVVIDGTEEVNEKLKGVEKAGTEAAAKVDDAFEKSSQSLLSLSEKAGRFGSIWTQNVTMPIIALGTAAIAMSADVLKGEESVAKLTDAWKDLKSDVATAIVPTINALITDTLIPLVDTLGDLVTKWGEQSEAAKDAQLKIFGITAIVGPVVKGAADIGTQIGILMLAFRALKIEAAAAWLAVAGPVGLAIGAGVVAVAAMDWGAKNIPTSSIWEGDYPTDWDIIAGTGGPSPEIAGTWGALSQSDLELWLTEPNLPVRTRAEAKLNEYRLWLADFNARGRGGGGGGGLPPMTLEEQQIDEMVRNWGGGEQVRGLPGGPASDFEHWKLIMGWGADETFPAPQNISTAQTGFNAVPYGTHWQGRAGLGPGPGGLSVYQQFQRGRGMIGTAPSEPSGPSWYDNLMSNEFLINAGATIAGTLAGGGGVAEIAQSVLPMAGWAIGAQIGASGGPIGAAIGALLGGLFQKKQRGDTPQNPVHVKVINLGDLATAMSNAVKSLVAQLGAQGLDSLVKQVRMQGQLKGYS